MLERMWSKRNSHSLMGTQNSTATVKREFQFLTKLNTFSQNNPAIIFCGIHSNELKHLSPQKNLHTDVFYQHCSWPPKPGSNQHVEEWKKTVVHWEMKYYLVLKRNELSTHKKTWRKLQCILLSERHQTQKATHSMTPTLQYPGKEELWRQFKRIRDS